MKRISQNSVQMSFEKDGTDWFAVIPEWEGSRADLQMVANADVMCDIISPTGENVMVLMNTEPMTHEIKLIKVQDTPDIGGAVYACHWSDNYNLDPFEIWLCGVTEYVFNNLPENIYIKVLS